MNENEDQLRKRRNVTVDRGSDRPMIQKRIEIQSIGHSVISVYRTLGISDPFQ